MLVLRLVWGLVHVIAASRSELGIENLALRQQLQALKRTGKRPRLTPADHAFWALLSRLWSDWRGSLLIVQPATVVGWHRQGFRLYWRWKSRKAGRPRVDAEVRQLIRRMSKENPLWGAPRIQAELRMLGYDVAESTVAKYMVKREGPPSPSWKTFLKNHADEIVACDFFTVPTATFRVLYASVILSHDRRRVLHFNVTANPTAAWAAQQIIEAFPYDTAPKYLLRDNDAIYGEAFRKRVESLGIQEIRTAYQSPWQNGFVERLIGSVRREYLDHVIVLGERHLLRVLRSYFDYYHEARTHLSLGGDTPSGRVVEPPGNRDVIAIPLCGGLHHRYTRAA